MNTIYRVEHPRDNLGMCRSNYSPLLINNKLTEHLDKQMPLPLDDGIKKLGRDEYFGFESIDVYKKLTYGLRASLRKQGFKLCVYYGPIISRGNSGQVTFKKNDVKLLKMLSVR